MVTKYLYNESTYDYCQNQNYFLFIRASLQIMTFENYFVPVQVKQSEKQLVADFLADQPQIDEGACDDL